MIFNIHAGHNPDGKIACGAIGLIKESTEARNVAQRVIELLRKEGHTVYDCTVNNGTSQSDVLSKIVNKCNAHSADLDISIHFNAGRNNYHSDGRTGGTEVLVYNTSSKAMEEALRICEEISSLGLQNRGVKTNRNLYFLRKTKAPALLIEVLFVDDADDVKKYNCETMAKAIVQGLLNHPISSAALPKTEYFKVKITDNALNIRSGAGTNHKIVGCIRDHGTYTITKTSGSWGLLKSGAGWINISTKYVKYV